MGRIVGYRSAEDFLGDAADLLAGKPPRSRAVKSGDPARDVEAARKALAGHENDAMLRGDLAQALVTAGQHEEALTTTCGCGTKACSTTRASVACACPSCSGS